MSLRARFRPGAGQSRNRGPTRSKRRSDEASIDRIPHWATHISRRRSGSFECFLSGRQSSSGGYSSTRLQDTSGLAKYPRSVLIRSECAACSGVHSGISRTQKSSQCPRAAGLTFTQIPTIGLRFVLPRATTHRKKSSALSRWARYRRCSLASAVRENQHGVGAASVTDQGAQAGGEHTVGGRRKAR